MAIYTTSQAVDFITEATATPGKRRTYSRRKLMAAARAGTCPVWEWTTRGPLFSSAQLTAWLREQSATPPTQRGAA